MTAPLVQFSSVTHSVEVAPGREIPALHDVHLEVHPGEYIALMGSNGSGKSTLIRHMNALMLPTAGSVRISGLSTADPHATWQIRQQIGIVFQNPDHQMVAPVVEEEVAFGPENLGLARHEIKQRVDEALAAVRMQEWRKHNPSHLSGGQKQRVAIAAVLAMRPRLMALDEPTAMLDPEGRVDVLRLLTHLNRTFGMAIIHVTHTFEEAQEASRVVILSRGVIVADGPVSELGGDRHALRRLGIGASAPVRTLARIAERGLDLGTVLPLSIEKAADLLVSKIGERTAHPLVSPASIESLSSRATVATGGQVEVAFEQAGFEYMRGTPFATRALRDITATILRGERTALMGGTGSGKSTLMQHLNALLRATSGTVRVGPFDLSGRKVDVRALRRHVGLAFQFPEHQLFEETVAQDVAYGPRNLGMSQAETAHAVRHSLEQVGLPYDEFAERSPHALSGGEMRRVALAGVLATRPHLLVLDEPAAGLDASGQAHLLTLINDLQASGTTTFVVTHDVEFAVDAADRLLFLAQGRLAEDGPLTRLLGASQQLPSELTRPAANQIARAMRARGVEIDESVVTAGALAQEVMRAMMNLQAD